MNRRLRALEDEVMNLGQRLNTISDTVTQSLTANNRPINFIRRFDDIDARLNTVTTNTTATNTALANLSDRLNNINRQLTTVTTNMAPANLGDRLNNINTQLTTVATNTAPANLRDRLNNINTQLTTVATNTAPANLRDRLDNIDAGLNIVTANTAPQNLRDRLDHINIQLDAVNNSLITNGERLDDANGLLNTSLANDEGPIILDERLHSIKMELRAGQVSMSSMLAATNHFIAIQALQQCSTKFQHHC